jgi:hypothetical protein
VLKNPDVLADYPKPKLSDFYDPYESHLLGTVSRIYREKTGKLLFPAPGDTPSAPEGVMIDEEDYATFMKKYPRLFDKYYS